ncbi:N-acetylmannosamine-6-phosphate 2-epimerase [Cohnella silvisoli]|uniref:Putative N-acetylmannosamine-6-phosphate 2-epimerase n=1 Tax=Cohnella silvisoli TaxID=2873699 RepID=A0ABV1KS24_9BACL|nr:N-acetylmannosamine-6-phosphate 2-epimerase [Cohnella silvisoli]MCD9022388.1 N-acetylmannosamine-6-phosphate 2-epimerase [Cohnella silvisoli]
MNNIDILSSLKGGLIVSCQAYPGEILFGSDIMSKMALEAKNGGAVGIRANSPSDIAEIKSKTGLPVIGIWKERYADSSIYITPTLREAEAVAEAGADIVAIDATDRPRPGQERLEDIVAFLRSRYNVMLMADVSNVQEGIQAEKMGFDIVSTTLSGYTPYSRSLEGPDTELISELVKSLKIPVFAEGRIQTPDQATFCLRQGAYSVVVGSAITRPQTITKKFVDLILKSAVTGTA